ncbi:MULTISPECIES: hypothetical protein [unclassified Viridibacillus]|uniref:hypothetical protein n=1 Tax=unclassified Viridibacillus TaxID=2617942 RepID=UPI00096C66BF|nr:hypothetical protein [Viridibacillus sp. FSL H7-0596]OMC83157.1 hypothetical protein BK128_18735 [Viridibacillus sp. FSL H7-0596]
MSTLLSSKNENLLNYINRFLEETRGLSLFEAFEWIFKAFENPIIISSNNYFLAPHSVLENPNTHILRGNNLYQLTELKFNKVNNHFMEHEMISLFKMDDIPEKGSNQIENIPLTKNDFALFMRTWIALECLAYDKKLLSNRYSGKLPIIQYQMVKGQFSEAIIKIYSIINNYINGNTTLENKSFNVFIHNEIDDCMNTLINLTGGHGVLTETVSRKIYLSFVIKNLFVESE